MRFHSILALSRPACLLLTHGTYQVHQLDGLGCAGTRSAFSGNLPTSITTVPFVWETEGFLLAFSIECCTHKGSQQGHTPQRQPPP
jgi:hypothetical protein